ncbi:AAA family ATPase [Methanococcoides methylutens]|uniref:ABC transporter, ATP-binding protein n=1 Tax=Methanococcoides methylutens MM1 TaxID=1434104 RepID=A0A0E3SPB1_METMT|nr:AAA family ATPase [Methanococcoides methylutens]AKB84406.1 ABC transporter, ATP-binding protein [Methanococcoides methylutens MM1]
MFLRTISLRDSAEMDNSSYPFTIPVIRNFRELELTGNVTFFVGENGSGKSTLLEAIAHQAGFNTAGGSRNNLYEVHRSGSVFGEHLRFSWMPKVTEGFFLRSETFYDFASHIDELQKIDGRAYDAYGGRSLHEQSHGESFLSLFNNRFRKGLYLLDEPEAALSPLRQLSLLKIIHDMESSGRAQFIIATHSPILMGYPNSRILDFDGDRITEVEYEDTDHYNITKDFLNARERYFRELFR